MSNEENPNQHDQHDQYGWQGHSEGPDSRYGGWEPTSQGDGFDADATAFVHIPPEDLADIPLAAPGHGYVPPMIVPLTPAAGLDPAATGSWVVQTQAQQAEAEQRAREAAAHQGAGAIHWPDPNQQGGVPSGYQGPYEDTSHATAQWNFTEVLGETPTAPAAGHHDALDGQSPPGPVDHTGHTGHTGHVDYAGHTDDFGHAGNASRTDHADQLDHTGHADPVGHTAHTDDFGHSDPAGHTGQWTVPAADGDLPDASDAFPVPAQAQASPWYGDSARPATLPGGAPAPWAAQTPEPAPVPEPETDPVAVPEPRQTTEAEPVADGRADEPAERAEQSDEAAGPAEAEQESAAVPGPDAPDAAAVAEVSPAGADTRDGTATGPAPEAADAHAAPFTTPDAAPDTPEPEREPESGSSPDPDPEAVPAPAPAPLDAPSEHPAASYVLHVNGADRPVSDAWVGESLLYVLRERLGLAGAKDGCSQGECGACNVQVDGRLVASCLVPAATAAGSEVRTVEGLAVDGEPSDVQRALASCGAVQCGFCIPGMAMTVHDLLEGNHAPTELETRQALCGNLCRCSGYRGVLDAVADVVAAREASAEAAAAPPDEARVPHQAEPGAGGVQQGPHPHEGEAL
ncbi:2Fe-2S iron-sulfur cluster-binding protein [Streptomyces sp. V2I9]|uniref:2Fe-2S iron-sulfur cluster-binding protein n=1 Tax=Streptomyces sp. V2I9 TaxID=3042304 RepID=UPI002789ECBD|nr:2Fe-2S iron-sulfur cluster-binding protein [Streptomyces sp. V2I9]MDQ0984772.1 aerobic-type carbon monoxide dehydrogenase small subunit (CoxS/CutS family) [Streptomyces sp. V2I9]